MKPAFVFLALACASPGFTQDHRALSDAMTGLRESLAESRKERPLPTLWSKKGPYVRLPSWEMAALRNQEAFSAAGSGLTDAERAWAKEIFLDRVDLDAVRVVYAPSPADAPMAWGNTIRMPRGFMIDKATIIHELTHVWQYQTSGMTYLSDSFLRQACAFVKTGDRDGAYSYEITSGKSFFDYSAEQQAEIVEAYATNPAKAKQDAYVALIAEMRARSGRRKFTQLDAAVMMEKDAGLPSRWHAVPPGPVGVAPFNNEAGGVAQFELRF